MRGIVSHETHQFQEVEEQRLGQALQHKCAVDMLGVFAVRTAGWAKSLDPCGFETLKLIGELEEGQRQTWEGVGADKA